MNTGDVDADPDADHFYQSGWTWLDADSTATLTLDFSDAELFIGGEEQTNGPYSVANLDEVSNIGFQVALPGDDDPYPFGEGSGSFDLDVAPVPIPPAVLLLGSGLFGTAVFRRRRR